MDSKYKMSISLNVLKHLGVNLYSNIPAVLAEVIANAWDADATEVKVNLDQRQQVITISDDGHGMDVQDINDKYLYVGYRKRKELRGGLTKKRRKPMGRKGIGKLSLFSIADEIYVYSKKEKGTKEAFLMDAVAIKNAMQEESPSTSQDYAPKPIRFDVNIPTHGTVIKIKELKKFKLTKATETGLRKRIARRFGIIKESNKFKILINGTEVTFSDRDYFHKARFIFQYGDYDYAQHCRNLDEQAFSRPSSFTTKGKSYGRGKHKISGWIAIAKHSYDLDSGPARDSAENDNLNKITIVVRGKVAQEDILQEYRLGGLITKYMYGEINADFLDEDDQDDIATSSRQKISEDDGRYLALREFIRTELQHIWTETNTLKEKKGLETALKDNPYIRQWYDGLRPPVLKKTAMKIFSDIDKAGIEEMQKQEFYATSITAFESLKMNYALNQLENIDETNLRMFLQCLADLDQIEAMRYHDIVKERLAIIQKLENSVDENVIEKALQKYIFNHLWLLDPAWERATQYAYMEESFRVVMDRVTKKYRLRRIDIRYQRVMSAHVIVELKRPGRKLEKTEVEKQVRRYISAVQQELQKRNDNYPLEAVCIVDKLLSGWENPKTKKADEESLKAYSIRIITYRELIENARSAYSKFIQQSESVGELRKLIDNIRNYNPVDNHQQ